MEKKLIRISKIISFFIIICFSSLLHAFGSPMMIAATSFHHGDSSCNDYYDENLTIKFKECDLSKSTEEKKACYQKIQREEENKDKQATKNMVCAFIVLFIISAAFSYWWAKYVEN